MHSNRTQARPLGPCKAGRKTAKQPEGTPDAPTQSQLLPEHLHLEGSSRRGTDQGRIGQIGEGATLPGDWGCNPLPGKRLRRGQDAKAACKAAGHGFAMLTGRRPQDAKRPA